MPEKHLLDVREYIKTGKVTVLRENNILISGVGTFLPGEPIPFDNISSVLGELQDAPVKIKKWIEKTTPLMKEMLGIEYYHYAIDPITRQFTENNLTMAEKASRIALKNARMRPADVELIVYGGPYMFEMPSPSAKLQEMLGIDSCGELSIHSNCTSVYKSLLLAAELLSSGRYSSALVVTSNMSSSTLRAEYYNQKLVNKEELFLRWYLCDGAGAVVLKSVKEKKNGFFLEDVYMESIGGKKTSAMYMRYPSYYMSPLDIFNNGHHHLVQAFQDELGKNFFEDGKTVFYKGLCRMVNKFKIKPDDITYFLINMPTKHVVDLIVEECSGLGINNNRIFSSINKSGYSGPPAAVISLDGLLQQKKFRDQDLIVSFVSEVSKFLQAGFTIRYCE